MKQKFNRYYINLGQRTFSVLVPNIDISNLFVITTEAKSAVIFANEDSLMTLSKLTRFMETSGDSILYINAKQNELTDYLKERWSSQPYSKDLVLLYHSLHFRVHEWKQIRNLIKKSTSEEILVEIFESDEEDLPRNLKRFWYKDHLDFLDISEHSETIFLTGSAEIFKELAIDSLSLRLSGRATYLGHPGYHDHEHIDYYARREYTKGFKYSGWFLCLDYYDSELWER